MLNKTTDNLQSSIVLKDLSIDNYKAAAIINKNMLEQKDLEIEKYRLSSKAWMIGGISVTVVAVILLVTK